MNNIQELELRVANARKELEEVTRLLEESKKKPKRFVPEIGQQYWFVDNAGNIQTDIWYNTVYNKYRLLMDNVFETKELCKEGRIKIEIQARFKQLASDSWGDEEIDWEDWREDKYYIYFDHNFKKIKMNSARVCKIQGAFCFKTEESLEKAIKEIGEENILKYVLEV